MKKRTIPRNLSAEILDRLGLAVFVLADSRPLYSNRAAEVLRDRLRTTYQIEVDVLLADQIALLPDPASTLPPTRPVLAQITAPNGEPFYLHAIPLKQGAVAVSVRTIGSQIEAIRNRYGLSAREAQVAELVLRGYRNGDIAVALELAPATVKKHLTRIFDKVGVDSRTQLLTRLG